MNGTSHLTKNMNGPPQFNVGLKPINIENWLFPDDQSDWLIEKNRLIDENSVEVFQAYPQSLPAQIEAAEIIAQITKQPLKLDEPPLLAASRLVSDDLIIMEKAGDIWQLNALSLCAPTFFNAKYAIGKSLGLLHDPIPTEGFDLTNRIGRVFDNFAPDMVLERFNWTIQWGSQKHTPNGEVLRENARNADIKNAKSLLFERVERQTIRKLPNSGAIIFTIRIRLNNLWQMLQNPETRIAFEDAWFNAPQNVREYKKWAVLERHVDALLKV